MHVAVIRETIYKIILCYFRDNLEKIMKALRAIKMGHFAYVNYI